MSEYLIIYVIGASARVSEALMIFSIIGSMGAFFLFLYEREESPGFKYSKMAVKGVATSFVVGMLLYSLVPSYKDIAMIVGGGVALKAVNNEEIQKIPEGLARAVNIYLDQVGEE